MRAVDTVKLGWLREIRKVTPDTWKYTLDEAGHRAARKARPNARASADGPQSALTAELARASQKAQRYLKRRELTREDREDILAAALLWCWENREKYNLTLCIPLDAWFMNAVKDAHKAWARGERRNHGGDDLIDHYGAVDFTPQAAQALDVDHLLAALTTEERAVAQFQMAGMSRQEMMRHGLSERAIREARTRFKQLRREYGRV